MARVEISFDVDLRSGDLHAVKAYLSNELDGIDVEDPEDTQANFSSSNFKIEVID